MVVGVSWQTADVKASTMLSGVKFVASSGAGAGSAPRIISSEPWEARRAAPSGGGRWAARALCMLRLHYFSDNPALAVDDDEESVYAIELIKEFEAVGRAWKAFLADWLLKGAGLCMSPTLRPRCYLLMFCFCVKSYITSDLIRLNKCIGVLKTSNVVLVDLYTKYVAFIS